MSDALNPVDVRRVMAMLFRRWRLGLVIVLATLVGAAIVTYLRYPQFEAQIKVLIERAPGADVPYLREQIAFKKAEITETQCELMQSTPVLEEVVRRLKLDERPLPSESFRDRVHAWLRSVMDWCRDLYRGVKGWVWRNLLGSELAPLEPADPFRMALADLAKKVSVEPRPNTDIVVATVRDYDGEVATAIANTMGEIYLANDLERQRGRAREIYGLIDTQVDAFRPSYEAASKAVEDYEAEYDARLLKDRISTKIKEISALEIALGEFKQRQKDKIEALEIDLAALRETYEETHPQVRAKRSELERARRMLKDSEHPEDGNQTAYQLAEQIAAANQELELLSEREGRYSRLLSTLDQEEELYFQLKREREEALIAEATRAAGTHIIEPAIQPIKAASPKWTLSMLFGVFGGLFLAVSLSALLEFMNTAVRYPDDISQTGDTPVIGSVPRYGMLTGGQRCGVVMNFSASSPYVRSQIQLYERIAAAATQPVLTVTSPQRGDGRSTLAINLALCAEQIARRHTLLVDLNFERPRIERLMPYIKRQQGLHEVLDGKITWQDAIQAVKTVEGQPAVLTVGLSKRPILAAVVAERLPALLAEWQKEYAQIIFDTPPVLLSGLVGVVNRQHGHVILLASAGRTRRAVISAAVSRCEALKVDLLGIVLNKRRYAIPSYAYRRL